MTIENLKIRGARHHNLKNIDLNIPKHKLVVISGVSGSGKSTLAFDTIYAEGQRRYVESLSAYARQFLEIMDKPDVDVIEGLSPAIAIQQKTTSKNPRSTVGTTTEIYDYLRLLFSRVGIPFCPKCSRKISSQSIDTICNSVLKEFTSQQVLILSPLVRRKKGTHEKIFEKIKNDGYSRVRVDGSIHLLYADMPKLDKQLWHDIEIIVDRITIQKSERSRLFEAIETGVNASNGDVIIHSEKHTNIYSKNNACPHCGITIGEMEPRAFSFNSPFGMCQQCNGIGAKFEFEDDLIIPDPTKSILDGAIAPIYRAYGWENREVLKRIMRSYKIKSNVPIENLTERQYSLLLYGKSDVQGYDTGILQLLNLSYQRASTNMKEWYSQFMSFTPCRKCKGKKLRPESLAVQINKKGIIDVCDLQIDDCVQFFDNIVLNDVEKFIAKDVLKEITSRLGFLKNVGLGYLSLNRLSSTLSGGEAQRIRLATQIGSNLTGVLYVLDEPTIGLHQRDNARLISTLIKLRDLDNTIIIVEHDEVVIKNSDWIVDIGPGAGIHGGKIVFQGKVKDISKSNSITGKYLNKKLSITLKSKKRTQNGFLEVKNARQNNLKGIDVKFPLGLFISVTGVSGSGKSTLVNDILLNSLESKFYSVKKRIGLHTRIIGTGNIDKVISINQSPIGRTPRSNPATYVGVFTPIRTLFSETESSKKRGYKPGRFSFNVPDGRCSACDGDGVKKIEMQFLSDVFVKCSVCNGKRFDSETLSVKYKSKDISDILDMSVEEALKFFENIPSIKNKLQTIYDVGLGYIKLGQSSITLSGGEAQRVKLATELSKTHTGKTLYILDEPTTGLHFSDVQLLLNVLNRLCNLGNTIIVIEHNMDVIRNSDWIIDLGPEGGDKGGHIVTQGPPSDIIKSKSSYTAAYLKEYL